MNFKTLVSITSIALLSQSIFAQQAHRKTTAFFGFGKAATQQEIAILDIDVRPDGKGLPPGQGDATKGKMLYLAKCVACHGDNDTDLSKTKLLAPILVSDTTANSRPKAIGNYWPYATTLYDYLRRSMPYNAPGTLTDNEVYSITAYLLSANKIIKTTQVLNAKNLPKIIMPAKKLFIMDDRKGGPYVK